MTTLSATVLSIGELLIDLIAADDATDLDKVDRFVVRPGGAPANVAVALARQGVPSALCSVVGRDPFGDRLIAVLDENQVDRSAVRQDPRAETTLAFAWKDARGDGKFRLMRLADVLLSVDDVEAAAIASKLAIVLGSVSLSHQPSRRAIERAVEIAVENDVPICLDVNMRPTIWPDRETALAAILPLLEAASFIKLSLDDARFLLTLEDSEDLVSDTFEQISAYGFNSMVLTDGARGSWYSNASPSGFTGPVFVPAFEIEAIEPTGAGDAFVAGLIARLLESDWKPLETGDVRYASAAGALTTTRQGAIDSLPSRSEIESFLSTHA